MLTLEGLAKLADTNMAQDFLAGVDPSGTRVFGNAMKNEEDPNKHRLATSAGGFTGGALIGTLAPAALMGATAKGMKRFNPSLAEEFDVMAKGTIDALNPAALTRHVKAIKPLTDFKNKGGLFLDETKKLSNLTDDLSTGKAPDPERLREGAQIAQGARARQKELQDVEENLSKQFYKGKPVSEGGSRTFTALSTAGAGGLSGIMGAASANAQYNTGSKVKKMNEKEKTPGVAGLAKSSSSFF